MSSTNSPPSVRSVYQGSSNKVDTSIDKYIHKFADSQDASNPGVDKDEVVQDRVSTAQTVTETFYNLVTDFYEYGYGQSFHFTPLYDDKTFEECIADYEQEAARMIGAKPGMKILDVGCGVGGPGREVARATGSSVLGLNYNSYQIERAVHHTKKEQLDGLCSYLKGDFCNMKEIQDNTFDGGFAFEATCHSKDLVLVYKEIQRVLKPGGMFVDMAWCVTDDYDSQNPHHVKVVNDVMYGNSLPEPRSEQQMLAAMREAGLEVMEYRDLVSDGDQPWYRVLENDTCCTLKNFRMSKIGRITTNLVLRALETMSFVPKGTTKVSAMLEVGARSLVQSGKMGIFTPMFRCLARKPVQ